MASDVSIYLPQDIIRNILKRLPVKSLIRFVCVCKDWKNLIEDPSFIADHLQQSSYRDYSILFECNEVNVPFCRDLHLLDWGFQVREVQNVPLILMVGRIAGSCNGLLVCEIYNESPPSLLLWNPATTAFRHVPNSRTYSFVFDECITAFGFSPIVNDYKIVRTYSENLHGVTGVEVFSLSTGSWKRMDIGDLRRVKLYNETVTVNGAIFWTGLKLGEEEEEDGEGFVDVIVSFDIDKEEFALLQKPELYHSGDDKIIVYEHKLALLCDIYGDEEFPDLIELWVLDEVTCASGKTCSWTKTYSSCPLSCKFDSVNILRNEIICKPYPRKKDEAGREIIYLMNLTTNELRRFVIPHRGRAHSFKHYVESLVSVGNNSIEES